MHQLILLLLGCCCTVLPAKALEGAVAILYYWFPYLQYRCELCDRIAIGSLCSLCPFFQVTKTTNLPAGLRRPNPPQAETARRQGKTQQTQNKSSQTITIEKSPGYWGTIQPIRPFSHFASL